MLLKTKGVPSMRPIADRCRASMAPTRQLRPDSGLGFQVKVLQTSKVVPSRSEADTRVRIFYER